MVIGFCNAAGHILGTTVTSGRAMRSPREVIEQIRREMYLIGVEMDPTVARGTDGLKQMLGDSLRILSEDLYSSETHFVLELIQNADDNTYPDGVVPTITFRLSPSHLEVEN